MNRIASLCVVVNLLLASAACAGSRAGPYNPDIGRRGQTYGSSDLSSIDELDRDWGKRTGGFGIGEIRIYPFGHGLTDRIASANSAIALADSRIATLRAEAAAANDAAKAEAKRAKAEYKAAKKAAKKAGEPPPSPPVYQGPTAEQLKAEGDRKAEIALRANQRSYWNGERNARQRDLRRARGRIGGG